MEREPQESVQFIKALEQGEDSASKELWEQNFERLARFAEKKLGKHRRVKDGDDIAAQAMQSFIKRVQDKNWDLDSRNDLWKMLLTIASNKAKKHIASENAQRRGGGDVRGNSIFGRQSEGGTFDGFAGFSGVEDTAEAILEQCEDLLDGLSDTERSVARMMLEGSKREEISRELGYSIGHVDRSLKSIRTKLAATIESSNSE